MFVDGEGVAGVSGGSRVRVFEAIRRERREDPDVSIRELASRHGVHRRTVRQALASADVDKAGQLMVWSARVLICLPCRRARSVTAGATIPGLQ